MQAGSNCDKCKEYCTKERPQGCIHDCKLPCHPGKTILHFFSTIHFLYIKSNHFPNKIWCNFLNPIESLLK